MDKNVHPGQRCVSNDNLTCSWELSADAQDKSVGMLEQWTELQVLAHGQNRPR